MLKAPSMNTDEAKWYTRPLRIVELIDDFDRPVQSGNSEKEIAQQVGMYANCKHLHTFGKSTVMFGCDEIFFKTSVRTVELPDHLGDHLPLTQKHGLRVFVYFNVHWVREDYPQWAQKGADGTLLQIHYGTGYALCVNSEFRQIARTIARDLGKYPIDGIFLDGPFVLQTGCYCEHCNRLFKSRYGTELPKPPFHKKDLYLKFQEFRSDCLMEFIGDLKTALHSTNPQAIIYGNANGLNPARATGRDNRKWAKCVDILAAEGGFIFYIEPNRIPHWKPGATAKLLGTQASGKPVVVFLCGNHKPYDRYVLPAAETRLLFAETLAHGASPWYAILKENLVTEGAQAAKEMLSLAKINEEALTDTTSDAQVALLWSDVTQNYYGTAVDYSDFTAKESRNESHGRSIESFNGYYEALVRSHILFDLIDDISLTDRTLNKYRFLILPNAACIGELGVENLRRYVAEGGNLLATFESSLYNELGEARENFALADVLGVDYTGKILGPLPYDYISPTPDAVTYLGPMQQPLPTMPYALGVLPTTALPLLTLHEKLSARYLALPPLSKHPAMTVNFFGKGKAFYLSGNVDEFFWSHRIPEHFDWLTQPVLKTTPPKIRLTNVPQSVEISIRKQGEKRLIIHLINFTGAMQRPITQIIPLYNVELEFTEKTPRHIMSLISKNALKLMNNKIILPKLDCYEIITCDF
ncbi:MAG: beta-galactosidase trimerization domain-containing protein [Phycisphaerae bacterium]